MREQSNSTAGASRRALSGLVRDDSGVSAVEYSFLFGLLALVAISTIDGLAQATRNSLDRGVSSFDTRNTGEAAPTQASPSGTVGEPAPAEIAAPEPPTAGRQPGEPAPMAAPSI